MGWVGGGGAGLGSCEISTLKSHFILSRRWPVGCTPSRCFGILALDGSTALRALLPDLKLQAHTIWEEGTLPVTNDSPISHAFGCTPQCLPAPLTPPPPARQL